MSSKSYGTVYWGIKATEGKLRLLFVTKIFEFSQNDIFSEMKIMDDFFASKFSVLLVE